MRAANDIWRLCTGCNAAPKEFNTVCLSFFMWRHMWRGYSAWRMVVNDRNFVALDMARQNNGSAMLLIVSRGHVVAWRRHRRRH